jgi:proteasome lid subunit RPN8/RPN11
MLILAHSTAASSGCQGAVSLLADVHTHPGGAAQSRSDRENPMSALPGHVAIIVPRFARSMFDLVSIGQYRYLGCGRWRDGTPPRLRLSGIAFGACP